MPPSSEAQQQQQGGGENNGGVHTQEGSKKEAATTGGGVRYARCFSGLELSVGPGSLKDVDAGRLKSQIRKWAKAVVAYARQISFVASPRAAARSSSRRRAMSTRGRDGHGDGDGEANVPTTARSATFPAKSGVAAEANKKDEIEPAT
uniref:Uncharacterized protein n=1 Tax=Leersia perrieri TaxID=77586 RepID=A0A0D9V211_9ORYZ